MKRAALMLCLFLAAPAAHAESQPASEPTASEQLASPVHLDKCAGVSIVEWRPSRLSDVTKPSEAGILVVAKTCAFAIKKYPDFLKSKGYVFVQHPVSARIMMMPANNMADGHDPRNLNDTKGRFLNVQPKCCSWGIYDTPTKAIFLRNDPLLPSKEGSKHNRYFMRTMLHEFAHLLNHQWEVRARNFPYDKDAANAVDERVAEEWVAWLGIDFGTDSAEENLQMMGVKPVRMVP